MGTNVACIYLYSIFLHQLPANFAHLWLSLWALTGLTQSLHVTHFKLINWAMVPPFQFPSKPDKVSQTVILQSVQPHVCLMRVTMFSGNPG